MTLRVVIADDHGIVREGLGALLSAATAANAIARAQDVSFAIDRALAEPALAGRLRGAGVGVAGHSFGANTALMVAGARFELDGREQRFGDPRVRAAIVLSPPALRVPVRSIQRCSIE